MAYNQAKDYESALEPLKKCVEIKPDNSVALANLAIVYINLKDMYSAKEIYNKLVTLDPAMAEKLKKYINDAWSPPGGGTSRKGRWRNWQTR